MKEQLINDVLLKMQEVINREQLRVLERVLLAVMYSVEVVRMETALSTELDDNQYMLVPSSSICKRGTSAKRP